MLPACERSVDEDHRIAQFFPARFQQDRSIQQNGLNLTSISCLLQLSPNVGPDDRVDDLFERLAILTGPIVRAKHQSCELSTLNLLRRIEDRISEGLPQGNFHLRLSKRLMTRSISIENGHRHPLSQTTRDRTFPRADSPNQSD